MPKFRDALTGNAALAGHEVVGWGICGSAVAIGRQWLSMSNALLIHAIIAPVVFALLCLRFFRHWPGASPLRTSLSLVGIVIGLDLLVVAPLVEHSYAMFSSAIGTWIPFASTWLASFLVGRAPHVARSAHTYWTPLVRSRAIR